MKGKAVAEFQKASQQLEVVRLEQFADPYHLIGKYGELRRLLSDMQEFQH
jgi:hypothetical protein